MKTNYLWIGLLSALFITSCSNDNENAVETQTNDTVATLEPYISPKMAQTIAFLDTNKTVVPIEQLMPIINKSPATLYSSSSNVSSSITKSTTTLESYSGRSAQKVLYIDAPVSISAVQIANWEPALSSGTLNTQTTYYLSVIAVTWQLADSRKITQSYYVGTQIGVNPSDDTELGYTFQNPATNVYLFTSYVYALRTSTTNDGSRIFVPGGLYAYISLTDAFNLKWYYFAETA
jgi:hypothetical protein